MVTEIVMFEVPDDVSEEQVLEGFSSTVERWASNPDLMRKFYMFDAKRRVVGGVYLWKKREHADKWHGEEFRALVKKLYGAERASQLFDTPIVVDNVAATVERS